MVLLPLLGVLLVLAPGSWLLTRREVSAVGLVSWFGLAQVFSHLVLHTACADHDGSARVPMLLLLHVLAVLGCAAALRVGEAGLWGARGLRLAWRRWAGRILSRGWSVHVPCPGGQLTMPQPRGPRPRDVTAHQTTRRGPPAGLVPA